MTLLLSYLIFTKPLTEQHGTGLLLIAMGITLKLLPENKHTKRSSNPSAHPSASAKIAKPASSEEEITLVENLGQDEEKRPLV